MSEQPFTASEAPPGRLWFGVSGPLVAWIVHGITSFVIADASCSGSRVAPWAGFSSAGLRSILLAVTAIALAVAISAGIGSFRIWRRVSQSDLTRDQAEARVTFMALTGVFMATIFSIAIVWGGLGPILTGLCEAAR